MRNGYLYHTHICIVLSTRGSCSQLRLLDRKNINISSHLLISHVLVLQPGILFTASTLNAIMRLTNLLWRYCSCFRGQTQLSGTGEVVLLPQPWAVVVCRWPKQVLGEQQSLLAPRGPLLCEYVLWLPQARWGFSCNCCGKSWNENMVMVVEYFIRF